jgi:RNA polymerase sigma-70 factor (ECF subfamily)
LALVNGQVAVVVAPRGRLQMVIRLGFVDGRIGAIDVIADRPRLEALEISVLAD